MITVEDPDEDDDEELCTVIISLMQKGRRQLRDEGLDTLTIGRNRKRAFFAQVSFITPLCFRVRSVLRQGPWRGLHSAGHGLFPLHPQRGPLQGLHQPARGQRPLPPPARDLLRHPQYVRGRRARRVHPPRRYRKAQHGRGDAVSKIKSTLLSHR